MSSRNSYVDLDNRADVSLDQLPLALAANLRAMGMRSVPRIGSIYRNRNVLTTLQWGTWDPRNPNLDEYVQMIQRIPTWPGIPADRVQYFEWDDWGGATTYHPPGGTPIVLSAAARPYRLAPRPTHAPAVGAHNQPAPNQALQSGVSRLASQAMAAAPSTPPLARPSAVYTAARRAQGVPPSTRPTTTHTAVPTMQAAPIISQAPAVGLSNVAGAPPAAPSIPAPTFVPAPAPAPAPAPVSTPALAPASASAPGPNNPYNIGPGLAVTTPNAPLTPRADLIRLYRLNHPEPNRLIIVVQHHQTGLIRTHRYINPTPDWTSQQTISHLNHWRNQIRARNDPPQAILRNAIVPFTENERRLARRLVDDFGVH